MAEVKKYFSNNLFRGSEDRVIYSSEEYSFRQRLNLLSKSNVNNVEALDMPYMSYFRENNWTLDTRPANLNAYSAMIGRNDDVVGGQKLRYMPMTQSFSCVALFSNDIDAQLAYEALLFIQYPAEKMIIVEDSLTYKGYNVPIYVGINVTEIQFNPGYTEKNWLKENRIIPIKFKVQARSVVFSQLPQGPESDTFEEDSMPILAERVLLDFLPYRGENLAFNKFNLALLVEGVVNPDPDLNVDFRFPEEYNYINSISVYWDFPPELLSKYSPTAQLYINANDPVAVPVTQTEYTFNNLYEESYYTITIAFTSLKGAMYRYTLSTTTGGTSKIKFKGMKG